MIQQQRKAQRLIKHEQLHQHTHASRAAGATKLVARQVGGVFAFPHMSRLVPAIPSQRHDVLPKVEQAQNQYHTRPPTHDNANSRFDWSTEIKLNSFSDNQTAVSVIHVSLKEERADVFQIEFPKSSSVPAHNNDPGVESSIEKHNMDSNHNMHRIYPRAVSTTDAHGTNRSNNRPFDNTSFRGPSHTIDARNKIDTSYPYHPNHPTPLYLPSLSTNSTIPSS